MIQLEFLPFFKYGTFFLGISADKVDLQAQKIDESTMEPVGEVEDMAEGFAISIGLFILQIDFILHIKFKDGEK